MAMFSVPRPRCPRCGRELWRESPIWGGPDEDRCPHCDDGGDAPDLPPAVSAAKAA